MDDLYSFQNNSILNKPDFNNDGYRTAALQTAAGRRAGPPLLTSHGAKNPNRMNTGYQTSNVRGFNAAQDRPMTSVKAAGYKRSNSTFGSSVVAGSNFDPMKYTEDANLGTGSAGFQNSNTSHDPFQKPVNKVEKDISQMEQRVTFYIDESIRLSAQGDLSNSIEFAQKASSLEKEIMKLRETNGLLQGVSLDLAFNVNLNLGLQYEKNEMYSEALNVYRTLSQNRNFENVGRIKINMGNIYVKQGDYRRAIKYYQMALDQISGKYKMLRIKIMSNIGIVYLKMSAYDEAVASFDFIMNEKPDYAPGFQLICAHYATNNVAKMKETFKKMLNIDLGFDLNDGRYQLTRNTPFEKAYLDEIKSDQLYKLEQKRLESARYFVTSAAKLIAPKISGDQESGLNSGLNNNTTAFGKGFDWCVDEVKSSNNLSQLSNDLEVEKALYLLRAGNAKEAEKLLKAFEKRENSMVKAQACNNLAFIYIQQKKFDVAHKFVDISLSIDSFSSAALVNKGNIYMLQSKDPLGGLEGSPELIDMAIQCYKQALDYDSVCVEAMFNLSLLAIEQHDEMAAEKYLHLIQSILPSDPSVSYLYSQILDTADELKISELQKISNSTNDPGIQANIGRIYAQEGDQSSGFSFHYEAHKLLPSDTSTIEWLGKYYIESSFPEKALNYFEKACLIEPSNERWHLLVASCCFRMNSYEEAYNRLRQMIVKFPNSIELHKYAANAADRLGLMEENARFLKIADRLANQREQLQHRINSGRVRSGHLRAPSGNRSRENSAQPGSSRQLHSSGRPISGQQLPPNPNSLRQQAMKNSFNNSISREEKDNSPVIDGSYRDPIGEQISTRPRTAANKNPGLSAMQDDVGDYDVDDLLPD